MKLQFKCWALLTAVVVLSSCSAYQTVGGENVAMMHEVTRAMNAKSPFYYQGRRSGYDYFRFYASGRLLKVKCPVETSFIERPFAFSKSQTDWRKLESSEVPAFMPEIRVTSE